MVQTTKLIFGDDGVASLTPLTLLEVRVKCVSVVSAESFRRKEALSPDYKVRNAERGNIYSAEINASVIEDDKTVAKNCRDEYYRLKALLDAAATVPGLIAILETEMDFDSIDI